MFESSIISLALIVLSCLHLTSPQTPKKQPTSLGDLRKDNVPAYQLVKSSISMCVATCLEVDKHEKRCEYDAKSGKAIGGVCSGDFMRPSAIDRKMICVYERGDLEKGLTLDVLIESNLCSSILVLVTIKYISKTPEMIIIDTDLHKEAADMAEMESVSLHYKLGTLMGMNDSMTPTDFSRTFGLTGARAKWVTALTDLFSKPESENYEGLYIRWLYPGCPLDDCKTGPASDEHRLIDALKELQDGWKAKMPEKKWDISMEISAKQDNVYMGLGIEKLGKILSYFFILNYEWAEPKPTKAPKTGFQTPLAKNNISINELLIKNKASNKRFFYGVTATLIYYALDENRNRDLPTSAEEFFIVNTKSKYIAMAEACSMTSAKENNFTFVHPRNNQKTSFAKNNLVFIPYDEVGDVLEKVNAIFTTYNNRIGGAWMKEIGNDDFEGKNCKCGPFPTLRAVNEGLYGSTCTMKKCFQH